VQPQTFSLHWVSTYAATLATNHLTSFGRKTVFGQQRRLRPEAIGTFVALGLVAWWLADLWADPPPQAPAAPVQPKTGLKVFKLSFTDPLEMKTVLGQILELVPRPGGPFNQLGGMPVMGGQALGGVGGQAFGNIAAPPPNQFLGGVNNFMGGVGGVGIIGGAAGVVPGPYMAVAPRIQAVLVRAEDRDLKICADVVSVLDSAPGKPLPKVKNIGVFSLKHVDADHVKDLVGQLGFQVISLPLAKLVLTPDVTTLEELESVIREVDVPKRPRTPEEKRKKLFAEPPEES
jgi:hypothetical protein